MSIEEMIEMSKENEYDSKVFFIKLYQISKQGFYYNKETGFYYSLSYYR